MTCQQFVAKRYKSWKKVFSSQDSARDFHCYDRML